MTTIKEWYKRVNATWPETIPPLTFETGANAAQRLHRFITGENYVGTFVETSGRRYSSYPRRGKYPINTGRGWHHLVHDISHHHWHTVGRGERPHTRGHARLELRLIKEVVKRGWLEPTSPEPVAGNASGAGNGRYRHCPQARKLDRARQAMERWERKRKRAERAIAKLRRRVRYYERRVGT